MWVIFCLERNMWWAPNYWGYVDNIKGAGRYSYVEAKAIVEKANRYAKRDEPEEIAIREELVIGSSDVMSLIELIDMVVRDDSSMLEGILV